MGAIRVIKNDINFLMGYKDGQIFRNQVANDRAHICCVWPHTYSHSISLK